jgi:hypothetical protein
MRYLKEYNDYNSDFYHEITPDENAEYWNSIYRQVGIDDGLYNRDKVEFSKRIPNFSKEEIDYLLDRGFKLDKSLNIDWKHLMTKFDDDSGNHYYIYKGLDEWYLFWDYKYLRNPPNIYYKCDQWDGLIKFLNDNNL